MAKTNLEVSVKDLDWGRWAAHRINELEATLRTVVIECEPHTYGKPKYDLTLDHLHDIAQATLNNG